MLKLGRLVMLQSVFAAISLAYLFISTYRQEVTGESLSAAPLVPSIVMFLVYGACLLLPRFGRVNWYRGVMVLAVALFGGGGVIGNIMRYLDSGLEHYSTFSAFALAVAINTYGTVLNILAVFGLFKHAEADSDNFGSETG